MTSVEYGSSTNESIEECNEKDTEDFGTLLRNIRVKNINRIIFASLNINSIRNKFEQLKLFIVDNIDVLIITETKLDETFSTSSFIIDGFSKPYRRDRNANGGGVLIYVREDIPSKELKDHNFPEDIEGIFVELNFRKTKWLLFGSYRPPSQLVNYYFDKVSNSLDMYIAKYDKFLLAGDFNAEDSEPELCDFLDKYGAKNIVKDKTCYKNAANPSCIDLFITNSPSSFQNTVVLANGLSDFHKMPVTVLKTKFGKCKPKEVTYRDYKKFDEDLFKTDLKTALSSGCCTYEAFENIFLSTLNLHAPLKTKFIRANHAPYMTKALRKAIMRRSQLQTKYYKTKNQADYDLFKKQRNFVSRLYKKEKKKFYGNLDMKDILDNKMFWKYMKPLFSDKTVGKQKITLVNGQDIITENNELADTFNTFFKEAVSNLGIEENSDLIDFTDNDNQIDRAIEKFKNHPSILKINEMVSIGREFDFTNVSNSDVDDQMKKLNTKKASTFKNIPPKILKQNTDICSPILLGLINDSFHNSEFPDKLKVADITPVFKKDDATNVKNYRPVSVLPVASKIFERLMQTQMTDYINKYLSPFLCGYRTGFSAQHALIALLEKWKITLDKKGFAGAVLMDLSKAFDCLNHDLLIAKLIAYGFSKKSVMLIRSYLKNRWQRTKINTSFSSWSELIMGVPQGSVLGPLLFNIYLNDLFWINEEADVCNFADDTTLHACDLDLDTVIRKLEHDSLLAIEWFEANYMKLNADKCHLLVAGHKHELVWARIGKELIWESNEEKLLGVIIDRDLRFEMHVTSICKKASRKLTAIARYRRLLTFEKIRTLVKSFVESQFAYSPLVWMFHNRKINSKINRLHERALRLLYTDDVSDFDELLARDGSYTIHQRNIQALAIEMFKAKNNIGPQLLKDIFVEREYNGPSLRTVSDFVMPNVNTVHFGEDSLRFFGYKIWNLIPHEIKDVESLDVFKRRIKVWAPEKCPCRLCRLYIQGVGYC